MLMMNHTPPFDTTLLRRYLPDGALHFLECCHDHSIEAWLVGGAVRDALLAYYIATQNLVRPNFILRPPGTRDLDIAIACTPGQLTAFLQTIAIPFHDQGLVHGSVRIETDDGTFDVTCLRSETNHTGRHADMRYGVSLAEDAERRDFTINALYLDYTGQIYDPYQGAADLYHGIVRFIGDPARRIAEDYLRLWRYYICSSIFSEPHSPLICHPFDPKQLVLHVPLDRATTIVKRLLHLPDPYHVLRELNRHHIWQAYGLPSANVERLALLISIMATLPSTLVSYDVIAWYGLFEEKAYTITPHHHGKTQLDVFETIRHSTTIDETLLDIGVMTPQLWPAARVIAAVYHEHMFSDQPIQMLPKFPLTQTDLQELGYHNRRQWPEIFRTLRRVWLRSYCEPTQDMLREHLVQFINPA